MHRQATTSLRYRKTTGPIEQYWEDGIFFDPEPVVTCSSYRISSALGGPIINDRPRLFDHVGIKGALDALDINGLPPFSITGHGGQTDGKRSFLWHDKTSAHQAVPLDRAKRSVIPK